jgi:hypothetical protein
MNDKVPFPPLRDLPAGRHGARKQHLLSEIADTARERRLVWPIGRPLRLRIALPAVAVIGAAVAATVIALLPAGSGGPTNAAAAVLDRLAHRAAAQSLTPKPGQYLYVGSEAENAAFDESQIGACETLIPQKREIWIGTDGSGLIRETSGPGHWVNPDTCRRMEQKYGPGANVRYDLSQHSGDDWFAPQCLSLKPSNAVNWSNLSSDPQMLLQQMRQLDGGPPTPGEDFEHVGDFLRETDAPAAVRATILRAAALIPGIKLLGTVRDHDGRPGLGFAYPSHGEMIFDAETGELLGDQGRGDPQSWTVYLREKVVANLPSDPPAPLGPPCTNGGGFGHDTSGGSITNGAPLKSH